MSSRWKPHFYYSNAMLYSNTARCKKRSFQWICCGSAVLLLHFNSVCGPNMLELTKVHSMSLNTMNYKLIVAEITYNITHFTISYHIFYYKDLYNAVFGYWKHLLPVDLYSHCHNHIIFFNPATLHTMSSINNEWMDI